MDRYNPTLPINFVERVWLYLRHPRQSDGADTTNVDVLVELVEYCTNMTIGICRRKVKCAFEQEMNCFSQQDHITADDCSIDEVFQVCENHTHISSVSRKMFPSVASQIQRNSTVKNN